MKRSLRAGISVDDNLSRRYYVCAVDPCDQFRNSGLAKAVRAKAVTSRDASYRGKKAERCSRADRLDQVTTSTISSLKVYDRRTIFDNVATLGARGTEDKSAC